MNVLVVAGESSGDALAGDLVSELRQLNPDLTFWGTGGDNLRKAGAEILVDVADLHVVGFTEVIRRISFFRSTLRGIVRECELRKPTVAILVDYPGFNLRLARELSARGIHVVFYIAPQVWAWKPSRIETLRKYVDDLIVVFDFEVEFFAKHGITAHYFGHPLVDKIPERVPVRAAHSAQNIVYLPGSRPDEVRRHMPVMLSVMKIIGPDYRHTVLRADTVSHEAISAFLPDDNNLFAISDNMTEAMSNADAALVKSGTSTVQTALHGVGFAVIYKASRLSYMIAKRMIRVGFLAMVNILAGHTIVREFIQGEAIPNNIAAELQRILLDTQYRETMLRELHNVRKQLAGNGATRRAAEFINALPVITRTRG